MAPVASTDVTSEIARPNGEVVIGDMEPDGRVVLYIIKGLRSSCLLLPPN